MVEEELESKAEFIMPTKLTFEDIESDMSENISIQSTVFTPSWPKSALRKDGSPKWELKVQFKDQNVKFNVDKIWQAGEDFLTSTSTPDNVFRDPTLYLSEELLPCSFCNKEFEESKIVLHMKNCK